MVVFAASTTNHEKTTTTELESKGKGNDLPNDEIMYSATLTKDGTDDLEIREHLINQLALNKRYERGEHVTVHSLQFDDSMNGCTGTIVGYKAQDARYVVLLDDYYTESEPTHRKGSRIGFFFKKKKEKDDERNQSKIVLIRNCNLKRICYHGSKKEYFTQDEGNREFDKCMTDWFNQSDIATVVNVKGYSDSDIHKKLAQFYGANKRIIDQEDFYNYVFAFCADKYLKGDIYHARSGLFFALQCRYIFYPIKGCGYADRDNLRKYNAYKLRIYTERGLASCISDHVPCNCFSMLRVNKKHDETREENLTRCVVCQEKCERPKRCSRCKDAHYCSQECQVRHWPEHKVYCDIKRKELKKKYCKPTVANQLRKRYRRYKILQEIMEERARQEAEARALRDAQICYGCN